MATGLGALTEGFQSGYKFSRTNARNKLIDKALNYEINEMGEGEKAREAAYKRLGHDYTGNKDFVPETWGSKLLGKIKGVFSKPAQAIDPKNAPDPVLAEQAPLTQPAPESSMQGMQGMGGGMEQPYKHGGKAIARYAHGGSTRHMARAMGDRTQAISPNEPVAHYADGGKTYTKEERLKRSYGKYYLTEEEAAERVVPPGAGMSGATQPRGRPGVQSQLMHDDTTGGGFREGVKDVGRSIGKNFKGTYDAAIAGGKLMDDGQRGMDEAEGATETGRALRGAAVSGVTAAGETTVALSKDLLEVSGAGPLYRGIKGFFSGDGGDEKTAAVQALPKGDTPEEEAKAIAGNASQASTTNSPNQVANAQPTTTAEEIEATEDPIVDMSQVREIRPEDMPNKGAKEWEEERNFWAAQAIANGEDALAAMEAVDKKQMRGFSMYAEQAADLLLAGNAPAAANALYAAYQYFPNGVDVRFGIMKGDDGQPVIIGMGTNEETGESEGKPTVMTAESISVMSENMQKPGAMRAWTKDWREAEQAIREYNEVTKVEAQANVTYRAKAGDALLMNAQARLKAAMASAAGGGLKQSDYDRAFAAMSGDLDTMALFEDVPPDEADYLKSVMAVAYRNSPGNFPRVSQVIRQAYRDGGIGAVDEMFGGSGGP